jgi:hypothetical protein
MLESDIGMNLSGYMHILFKYGTKLPFETEVSVKPASDNVELSLYQGPHAYCNENHFIGSTQLSHTIGNFIIKFIIDDTIKVYINNEIICEFIYKKENLGYSTEKDILNHEREFARQNYTDYINETISTLEQIKDKIDKININIIQRVIDAGQVSQIQDVSTEEFELAQQEIENWLNPIMKLI